MRPTDEKETEQKIKAMADNKVFGPNSTRTKILKAHSKTLKLHQCRFENLSICLCLCKNNVLKTFLTV